LQSWPEVVENGESENEGTAAGGEEDDQAKIEAFLTHLRKEETAKYG
jgi:hypothetical protein